jgi:hypothetical protein
MAISICISPQGNDKNSGGSEDPFASLNRAQQEIRSLINAFEEGQSFGTDLDSRVVDPGFVDAPGGDYTLRADSPLPGTGFRPLPLEKMFIGNLGTAGAIKVE